MSSGYQLGDAKTIGDSLSDYGVSKDSTLGDILSAVDSFGSTEFGESNSVAVDSTSTVVEFTATNDVGLAGFTANGTSDGRYRLQLNGQNITSAFANQASPNATVAIDNPIPVSTNDTVSVEVKNSGLEMSDYEATIFIRDT